MRLTVGVSVLAAQRPQHAVDGLDLIAVAFDADQARQRQQLGEALRAGETMSVDRVTELRQRRRRAFEQRREPRDGRRLDAHGPRA